MKVKDLMTRQVAMIRSDATLDGVAKRMKLLDVEVLLVQEKNQIVGIITDRDIVIKATAEGLDLKTIRVNEIMTGKIVSCSQEEDIENVVKMMEDRHVHTLIVLNSDNRPVGIFSIGDPAVNACNERLTWDVVEEIREPVRANRYPLDCYGLAE